MGRNACCTLLETLLDTSYRGSAPQRFAQFKRLDELTSSAFLSCSCRSGLSDISASSFASATQHQGGRKGPSRGKASENQDWESLTDTR